MGRIHRVALKLHNTLASLIVYISEIWIVLLCILLEAANVIFFDDTVNGFTYAVFSLLGLLLLFLVCEFLLEVAVHGLKHYFRSFKGFFSLFDVPICVALTLLALLSEILHTVFPPPVDTIVIFITLSVLFCYLFVRLTLRVGSKNILQLPHGKKVACVRSVDFVWVNSSNGDTEWMLDDLRDLDTHRRNCKSQCSSGLEFYHQLYITREQPASEEPFESVHFHKGRPDWDKIFAETTERVLSHAQLIGNTIGVFFCGPPVLGELLHKECIVQTIKSNAAGTPVYFIYHQEIF